MTKPIRLARREREIVSLAVQGKAAKQIAAELELTVGTVNSRILGVAHKVGVINRQELIIWVLQNPQVLRMGGSADAGLHLPGCECTAIYCTAMRHAAA